MKTTRFLMGTLVTIEARGEGLEPAADSALGEMTRIEKLMSRFLPTSDVGRLNTAHGQPVNLSPETFGVLEEALLFSQLSAGAFDVTVASQNGADYNDILLNKEKCQVSLKKPGMAIDLGGIAKGYAVDRAIEVLREMGIHDALINAGGEVRVLGSGDSDKGWAVGVQHPRVHKSLLCRLPLVNRAVATSGDYYRYQMRKGRWHCHILDPLHGDSARCCLTTTVVADQAMVADALATAVFVLGPGDGMHLIESLPGVEALVVGKDGSITTSPGLVALWNDRSGQAAKHHDNKVRRYYPVSILLGSMVLLNSLTLGCQTDVEVPAPSELTQQESSNIAETRIFLDGTYQGKSVSGVLVEVEVTVQSGRITDIEILEYREISKIHAGKPTTVEEDSWQSTKDWVLKIIPEMIIEKQSASVDTVTGATMSSETIMNAVEDALAKAEVQEIK